MAVLPTTVEEREGEVCGGGRRISAMVFSNSGQCPYRVQMKDHNTGVNIIHSRSHKYELLKLWV